MIKNIILIFILLLFSSCAVNQNRLEPIKKEPIDEELLSHVRYILYLIQTNDLKNLNEIYINKNYGYFEVNLNEFENKPQIVKKYQIDEIDTYIESFDIQNIEVSFNCSPYNDAFYGWNKDGIFIFEPKTNYLDTFLNDKTKEEQEFIKKVKNGSYEVVATNNTIFYITKIDKKYYITLIDNLQTNCSNALIQAF
ncbi:hypothetical protein [Aliarcobacter cryaerophilus]|uniref:Lipoprotein n=1 Tax=Aliarcobacter cryaerophilus TaxID=28198 RepID=A0A2S9TM38_9BACT|nr:hypothetical protein [Aliarcobacter cryaerophilus]PRM99915.1 hypothetical protein CJ668_08995 [Arcobacter cryaerophilus gv. pseudocryaerophilus]